MFYQVLKYFVGRKMTSSIGTLEKEIGEDVCSVLPFP